MLKDQIDGKNDSWAIRWYISCFLKNKLCLYLGKPVVTNIGFGVKGATHCNVELPQHDIYRLDLQKIIDSTCLPRAISKSKILKKFVKS